VAGEEAEKGRPVQDAVGGRRLASCRLKSGGEVGLCGLCLFKTCPPPLTCPRSLPWLHNAHRHAPWYTSYQSHFKENVCMQQVYESLLIKYSADLVFNGHVHCAQAFLSLLEKLPCSTALLQLPCTASHTHTHLRHTLTLAHDSLRARKAGQQLGARRHRLRAGILCPGQRRQHRRRRHKVCDVQL
jgi:hypothetical protein